MRRIKRFDELPNKIKYVVGGGIKDNDKAHKQFGQMEVYECKNRDEIYKQMTLETLQPATLIDKNPLQGRSFFVAVGMPYRERAIDFATGNMEPVMGTVVYFAQLNKTELNEVLRDEKVARDTHREKLKERELLKLQKEEKLRNKKNDNK